MMIHKRIWEMTQGVRKFIFLKSGVGILISISYIVQVVFLGKIIMQVYGHENVENLYFNLIILITMLMARIFLIWFNQVYGKWIVSRVKNTLILKVNMLWIVLFLKPMKQDFILK